MSEQNTPTPEKESARQRLLVDCSDEPGLIYRITNVLYQHEGNIVSNQEFVDPSTGRFFMRSEFTGGTQLSSITPELEVVLPPDAHIKLTRARDRRVVVLVTKEHHCLGELLLLDLFGELGGSVKAVVGNHATLRPLAERFGVPFHHISHKGISREEHEALVSSAVDRYDPEYLVLAKYMRVFTPSFLERYPRRIINIHHSFLPAFMGAQPYRQAFERGVKIIGATAHLVTEALDEGPIIAQSTLPVDHSYDPARMAQAGRDVEKLVLARALKLVFEDRVFLVGNRTIVFD